MNFCKLQIGCFLIVLYVLFNYLRECKKYKKSLRKSIYDEILYLALISIGLDGITAVTVNYLDVVNLWVNRILHMCFLISLDTVIYMMFGYILKTSYDYRIPKAKRILLSLPYLINVIILVANIGNLEFRTGQYTNYSMGISAYTCFGIAVIYVLFIVLAVIKRWNYIDANKRINILTFLISVGGVVVIQGIFPESLFTSVVVTLLVLCVYMTQEDPVYDELSKYHDEMVMGFATLVESKDGSTGGHVKRTTAYVKLLSEELRNRGYYKEILTNDYIHNLSMAAPMHDIGKIGVPVVVLQKTGKLTDEEYEIIKKHASEGGRIIEETFGHLGNIDYTEMSYQVAKYHHEKWNGKGYPEGLAEKEIPLCARIMAVADVFDAVSEKRCYRDALPLEKCYEIISNGSGKDFDPLIVEVFLDSKEKIEKQYKDISLR